MLPEDPHPLDPARLITGRHCTHRGAWVFPLTYVVVLLAQFGMFYAVQSMAPQNRSNFSVNELLITLYIVLPPIAAIGAYVGHDLYRLASGSRPPNETKWYIWVLALCCFSYLTVCLWFQYRRRSKLIQERQPASLLGPIIYGAVIFILSSMVLDPAKRSASMFMEILQISSLALFLADCIIVNYVANCMQADLLAPPDSHKFQFSLRTLFFGTLLFGAYASGLVMILR